MLLKIFLKSLILHFSEGCFLIKVNYCIKNIIFGALLIILIFACLLIFLFLHKHL